MDRESEGQKRREVRLFVQIGSWSSHGVRCFVLLQKTKSSIVSAWMGCIPSCGGWDGWVQ